MAKDAVVKADQGFRDSLEAGICDEESQLSSSDKFADVQS